MSKNQQNHNTNFEIINKISKKYFLEIEHTVPHLQQTLFDFQNEFYKIWKNSINSNLSLQKEFFGKSGLNYILPEAFQKIIETIENENAKYRSIYNKTLIKTIESGKENAKLWTDNASTFVDLNQKILQYWMSVFSVNHFNPK